MGVTIDYDKFGHCTMCHKNMVVEQVVDMKVIQRFTPDYDEVEYLLDDGSTMRVVVCKQCKVTLTEKDEPRIMECVIKGWKHEVDGFRHWTDAKKQYHMEIYSKKRIVGNSEGLAPDVLQKKLKEFHERKVKDEGALHSS